MHYQSEVTGRAGAAVQLFLDYRKSFIRGILSDESTTLVSVVVEEGEVVEVALVGGTSPNNFRGVGEGQRDTVDAKEDEVGVYEVFHEAEAHLILFERS